jgi:DNA-binding XRE family transcriptional regulator
MSSNIGQQPEELIVKKVNNDGTETIFKIEARFFDEIVDRRIEEKFRRMNTDSVNDVCRTSEAKSAYKYDKVWTKTDFESTKKYRVENNLKNIIRKSGLSQGEIAEVIGINESTLSDIVNAKSSSSLLTILKLCTLLNIPVDGNFWLVIDED